MHPQKLTEVGGERAGKNLTNTFSKKFIRRKLSTSDARRSSNPHQDLTTLAS